MLCWSSSVEQIAHVFVCYAAIYRLIRNSLAARFGNHGSQCSGRSVYVSGASHSMDSAINLRRDMIGGWSTENGLMGCFSACVLLREVLKQQSGFFAGKVEFWGMLSKKTQIPYWF
eukprot:6461010-Amphidinium_carterae.1